MSSEGPSNGYTTAEGVRVSGLEGYGGPRGWEPPKGRETKTLTPGQRARKVMKKIREMLSRKMPPVQSNENSAPETKDPTTIYSVAEVDTFIKKAQDESLTNNHLTPEDVLRDEATIESSEQIQILTNMVLDLDPQADPQEKLLQLQKETVSSVNALLKKLLQKRAEQINVQGNNNVRVYTNAKGQSYLVDATRYPAPQSPPNIVYHAAPRFTPNYSLLPQRQSSVVPFPFIDNQVSGTITALREFSGFTYDLSSTSEFIDQAKILRDKATELRETAEARIKPIFMAKLQAASALISHTNLAELFKDIKDSQQHNNVPAQSLSRTFDMLRLADAIDRGDNIEESFEKIKMYTEIITSNAYAYAEAGLLNKTGRAYSQTLSSNFDIDCFKTLVGNKYSTVLGTDLDTYTKRMSRIQSTVESRSDRDRTFLQNSKLPETREALEFLEIVKSLSSRNGDYQLSRDLLLALYDYAGINVPDPDYDPYAANY